MSGALARLVAGAAAADATFRVSRRPDGFVEAYWAWGSGYPALRVSDRWRGAEELENLLRLLERRLPPEEDQL